MDVQPELAFRNVEATDELKDRILAGIDKLEEVYDHIITCRVMVEETNPGRKAGKLNHVRLDISVPNHEVVINRNPPVHPASQDLPQAVNEAFDKAWRKLRELKRQQRGNGHGRAADELPPHGRVVRLLVDDTGTRYGFLMSRDGRQVYFHENAVADMDYDDLEVGDEVRYAERQGDEGPQASTVSPLKESAVGPRQEEEVPLQSPSG